MLASYLRESQNNKRNAETNPRLNAEKQKRRKQKRRKQKRKKPATTVFPTAKLYISTSTRQPVRLNLLVDHKSQRKITKDGLDGDDAYVTEQG